MASEISDNGKLTCELCDADALSVVVYPPHYVGRVDKSEYVGYGIWFHGAVG